MACRGLIVDPQRINHSNGNFVPIVGALCLIRRGSRLDAVIVADPGGFRRLAYASRSRPAASTAAAAPTAAERPAICGSRRTTGRTWQPGAGCQVLASGPRSLVVGAPGSGGRSRRRRREHGVPQLVRPGRERRRVAADVELDRLALLAGHGDPVRRAGAAADGEHEQRLAVVLVHARCGFRRRGDDRPGELRQPVPLGDRVDPVQAADGSLVALDAEHDAPAVAVRERGYGLEDGPLGLGRVAGQLALELHLQALALRQQGLDLRLWILGNLDVHARAGQVGCRRVVADGPVVQPLPVPAQVQPSATGQAVRERKGDLAGFLWRGRRTGRSRC